MEVALETNNILPFLLGGNSLFTMVGATSRFTYKVRQDQHIPNHLKVFVLTGPDNLRSYTRLGTVIKDSREVRSRNLDAPSMKAFRWVFERLKRNLDIHPVVVLHHGLCCRCGRVLTTPESIRAGIGPICMDKA